MYRKELFISCPWRAFGPKEYLVWHFNYLWFNDKDNEVFCFPWIYFSCQQDEFSLSSVISKCFQGGEEKVGGSSNADAECIMARCRICWIIWKCLLWLGALFWDGNKRENIY